MSRSDRGAGGVVIAAVLLVAGSAGSATAQGGPAVYVPAGGGGFIPYSPGPAGGLGVQPRMGAMERPAARVVMPGGMAPTLGAVRSRIAPLAPISAAGGGSMTRRPTGRLLPAGGMGGAGRRRPVGAYPFRQPPSLLGPSLSPGMSM